eukprot:CAMPEP_0116829646 /NCGR_PEP_ID=MMETSP0418-20121206/4330_1 /TAXON_ID=1158023 /ORGANISM="Astrosyne radiata, Strain 13vi08-1A" /LENGTH=295 /DNA_ID=CAMNT_0004458675 /DNA_START=343 /DNA_END=1230 /DNA_ORIENTATION=-
MTINENDERIQNDDERALFVEEIFLTLCRLCKGVYYHAIVYKDAPKARRALFREPPLYNALQAASYCHSSCCDLHCCPLDFVQEILRRVGRGALAEMYRGQTPLQMILTTPPQNEDNDNHHNNGHYSGGFSCLHYPNKTSKATKNRTEGDWIRFYVQENPHMALIDDANGYFPLHRACQSGVSWNEGLKELFQSAPQVLTLESNKRRRNNGNHVIPPHPLCLFSLAHAQTNNKQQQQQQQQQPSYHRYASSSSTSSLAMFHQNYICQVRKEKDLQVLETIYHLLRNDPILVQQFC